ncbi:MAG: hypothetical protein PV340_05000 [Wolbachia sp.]|nr:hypothetical protein [Wolbachia sp.]MDD9336357.1 hypothetical protein [Wolbachia sp.]
MALIDEFAFFELDPNELNVKIEKYEGNMQIQDAKNHEIMTNIHQLCWTIAILIYWITWPMSWVFELLIQLSFLTLDFFQNSISASNFIVEVCPRSSNTFECFVVALHK